MHPAVKNDGHTGVAWYAVRNITQDGLRNLVVGLSYSAFDERALGLVKPTTEARAQIDGVRSRGSEPALVTPVRRS